MNGFLVSPGPVEPYGEWGCHNCTPSGSDIWRRDILPENAELRALEHLQETGHSVYVVKGTAQALHAVRTEAPAGAA